MQTGTNAKDKNIDIWSKINMDIRTHLYRLTDILEYINADTRTNANKNLQTHVNTQS